MIAGTTCSAWTTAFTKNDMKPSLISCFLTKRSWNFVRSAMMLERSTSLKVVRCAVSCCAARRRAAIFWRNGDIFLREVRSPAVRAEGRHGGWDTRLPRPALSAAASTSPLSMRPSLPVPWIEAGIDALFLGLITHGGGNFVGMSCRGRRRRPVRQLRRARLLPSRRCRSFGGGRRRRSAGAGAFSSMLATTWPICTVSPALTRCFSWPALSATTSDVTLSVSISKMVRPT